MDVGSIVVATGFDDYEPAAGEFGYGLDGVVTLPEFKKMVDEAPGPLQYQGRPVKTVAYIYCVGSRQAEGVEGAHTYCSRYCCTAAVHAALEAAASSTATCASTTSTATCGPTASTSCSGTSRARRARSTCACPTTSRRRWRSSPPAASRSRPRTCSPAAKRSRSRPTSSCSSPAWCRARTPSWSSVLKLPVGNDGFFNEIHPKLRPVETIVDGVLICGACQAPKNVGRERSPAAWPP